MSTQFFNISGSGGGGEPAGSVDSVFGRSGTVSALADDYSELNTLNITGQFSVRTDQLFVDVTGNIGQGTNTPLSFGSAYKIFDTVATAGAYSRHFIDGAERFSVLTVAGSANFNSHNGADLHIGAQSNNQIVCRSADQALLLPMVASNTFSDMVIIDDSTGELGKTPIPYHKQVVVGVMSTPGNTISGILPLTAPMSTSSYILNFVQSTGLAEFTVSLAGTYKLYANYEGDRADTQNGEVDPNQWWELNGAELPGSRSRGYSRNNSRGQWVLHSQATRVDLLVGDVVRCRHQISKTGMVLSYSTDANTIEVTYLG